MKTRLSLYSLSAALLILLFAAGCGVKTPPVSPDQVVPRPITDLRYSLDSSGVTLTWSYPAETVNGDPLDEIAGFDVYRAVIPVDEYCETCPVPWGEPFRVAGGAVDREGRRTATYHTALLRPGHMYFFKVRSHSGWWSESADSNEVSFTWFTPARAPEGLKAEPGDGLIRLTWEPVTTLIDGSPIEVPVMYKVLRSRGGGRFTPLGDPVVGTQLTDTTVAPGRRYFYRVQAVTLHGRAAVDGGLTEPVAAASVDRTPPAPPLNLTVAPVSKGWKLLWIQLDDPDVAGFRVYRRLDGSSTWTLIGEVVEKSTQFIDSKPPRRAARWFYAVSSIDAADPPNESERSVEVMAQP